MTNRVQYRPHKEKFYLPYDSPKDHSSKLKTKNLPWGTPMGISVDADVRQVLQQPGMIHCIEGLREVQKNSTCKGTSVHILEDVVCEMGQGCSS